MSVNVLPPLVLNYANYVYEEIRLFWVSNKDPRGSEFALIRDGPWTIVALTCLFAIIGGIIGPAYMRNRKPYDLRPYMIVYNGLLFGMNGIGFLIAFTLSDNGHQCWHCNAANPRSQDLRTLAVITLAFVYLGIKLLAYFRVLFDVLRKKPTNRTLINLGHIFQITLQVHFVMYFYPGGIFTFLPVADCLNDSIVYGYCLLSSAAGSSKPGGLIGWKRTVILAQLVHFGLLLVHGVYFTVYPCAPLTVPVSQALYAITSIVFIIRLHWSLLLAHVDRKVMAATATTPKKSKQK